MSFTRPHFAPVAVLSLWISACTGSPTTASSTSSTTSAATTTTTPAPSVAFSPSISFTGGDVFVVGQSRQLTAFERQSASSAQDVTTMAAWQSSNPGVATVSSTGLVTAVALGATIITASDQAVTGSLVVTVVARTVSAVLVVGPTTVPAGEAVELTASASTIGGKQVVTDGVVWQSSNPAIASVSDAGVLTAVSPGTTTVSATYQGVAGTLTVTVVDVAVTAITFSGNTTVTRGLTAQLTATASLADGSSRVVTNFAAWASLNTDIATVSSGGLVTALSTAGTATITATFLGTTGSVDITVN